MEDSVESGSKQTTIKRIGGYLHRVVPIMDKSGKILSYTLKPLMVEFRARDVFQVVVGASILAIPVAFTEEAWTLAETLPLPNVLMLSLLSLCIVSLFVFYNFYGLNIKGHVWSFVLRVLSTYFISLAVVALLLTVIQKFPWQADTLLALKRAIIVAFPASMSATISDTIK